MSNNSNDVPTVIVPQIESDQLYRLCHRVSLDYPFYHCDRKQGHKGPHSWQLAGIGEHYEPHVPDSSK